MNEKGIKELAIKEGFLFAEITDTENFVFDFSFRRYCEEDLCGLFGKNFSCPPSCGEPEELKQRVLKHKKALLQKLLYSIIINYPKDIYLLYKR